MYGAKVTAGAERLLFIFNLLGPSGVCPDGVCGLDGIGKFPPVNRVSIGVDGPPLDVNLKSIFVELFPATVFVTDPLILF